MFEICAECEKLALDSGRQWSFLQLRQKVNSSVVKPQQKNKSLPHIVSVTWSTCEQHDEDDKLSLNRSI